MNAVISFKDGKNPIDYDVCPGWTSAHDLQKLVGLIHGPDVKFSVMIPAVRLHQELVSKL